MYAVCLLLCMLTSVYCNEEGPFVQTPLGAALGYYKMSHGGRRFSVFEGLPYAKPPIGDRRFEEPEPIEPWIGVWNATSSTMCAQTSMIPTNSTQLVEDCLHINVYVPRETPNSGDKMDVIVHIHGGAFLYCSGNYYAGPEFVMDRDVVFVTFNYRLGIFGFLSTEDDVVPGNNGLKDQTMALKWVQQNIASFGGNPDSVTITGTSAGGSSVHLHYLSDLSKGLFHRGFSESGVAMNPWVIQEEPLMRTKKLAAAVGCPTTNTRILVDCLKQRPVKQILDKLEQFFVYSFLPLVPFGPVVEKGGRNPFLKEDPYVLLKKGQVADLPWIDSVTSHEGILPVMFFMNDLDTVEEKWDELAPFILEYNYTAPKSSWKSIAQTVRKQYLGNNKINQENYLKLVEMFTDRYFAAAAETAIRMQTQVTKSPLYFYVFAYPGDNNPQKTVPHAADAKYFFKNAFTTVPLTENELQMSKILNDMLIEFSRTGKATIKGVEWQPTKSDKLTYLKINGIEDGEITLEVTEELTQRRFWQNLQLAEEENLIAKKEEL